MPEVRRACATRCSQSQTDKPTVYMHMHMHMHMHMYIHMLNLIRHQRTDRCNRETQMILRRRDVELYQEGG